MIYDEENFPELPASWSTLRVENACESLPVREKIQTKAYQASGRMPVVDQGAALIGGYTDDIEKAVTPQLPVVVFGDHTRAIKFVDFLFAAGADGIKVLAPMGFWVPRLFYRFLQAIRLPDKGYARHFQHLRALRIAIPPSNEQKRIADKLDALFARVDACRERLDRVSLIIKRFRRAVLAAATSGKLTEDWRPIGPTTEEWLASTATAGVPLPTGYKRLSKQSFKITKIEHSAGELPNSWTLLTIGDLYSMNVLIDFADGNHGSQYPRKEEFGDVGVIFITASQLGDKWELDLHGCQRLKTIKARQLTKGWARVDDVLLTHNATVGRVALVECISEPVLLGTSVTFYRFNPEFVVPRFARVLFSSPFFQQQLHSVMEQTTRDQVPITKQVSLNFICPPLDEQYEIIRRVEILFAFADRLETRYIAARTLVERLTPALLAKAFRGELVPQDPNDEPASALLDRIRSARAIAESTTGTERRIGSGLSTESLRTEVLMLTRKDIQPMHLSSLLRNRGPLTAEELWAASQLDIDDFYDQLKEEEARGLLKERRDDTSEELRLLESIG